jgi:uncharacterized FlaG/YvyC family protein
MRIDGINPSPPHSEPAAPEATTKPVHQAAAPAVQDHLEIQPKPKVDPTNVLVEIQPGNIVVYKFIDEANGQVIQQIPSEQMLNLAAAIESNEKHTKLKQE